MTRYERGYVLVRSNNKGEINEGIQLLKEEAVDNVFNRDDLYFNIALGYYRTYARNELRRLLLVTEDSRVRSLVDVFSNEDAQDSRRQNVQLRYFAGFLLFLSIAALTTRQSKN